MERNLMKLKTSSKILSAIGMSLLLGLTVSACSSDANHGDHQAADSAAEQQAPANTDEPQKEVSASGLKITDAWVKAVEEGMSSGFGVLTNTTAEDMTVVSATANVSDDIELHETVMNEDGQMVMREHQDGFVIPAGESYHLEPGGDHLMLMSITTPLQAGNTVEFTLTLDNGETVDFEAPIKDYSGANEQYEHEGHDHH